MVIYFHSTLEHIKLPKTTAGDTRKTFIQSWWGKKKNNNYRVVSRVSRPASVTVHPFSDLLTFLIIGFLIYKMKSSQLLTSDYLLRVLGEGVSGQVQGWQTEVGTVPRTPV